MKRYLNLWEQDGRGTVKLRQGGWNWGDWGNNIDMLSLYNLWYYLALQSQYNIAVELGYNKDADTYKGSLESFHEAFNRTFWNDSLNAYRDPLYRGKTDDRTQALAVVSGMAGKEKYPALLKILNEEEHASPYMEKYVFEAMMVMGFEEDALARHKKRFSKMVNDQRFTTLFEGWGIGTEGFGGGTVNHAWSGGGATIASQYITGISPLEPAYKRFQIKPQPGKIKEAKAVVPSVKGEIISEFKNGDKEFSLAVSIPTETEAVITLPPYNYATININGNKVWQNGKFIDNKGTRPYNTGDGISFIVPPGKFNVQGIFRK